MKLKRDRIRLFFIGMLLILVFLVSSCSTLGEVLMGVADSYDPTAALGNTQTCYTCEGEGVVWSTNFQGSGEWITCPKCGGDGLL